jgi:hypothetical protein
MDVSTPHQAAEPLDGEAGRRRDRLIGLVIVGVSFSLALAVSWWAKVASRPERSAPPGPPTIEGIVGWPEAVDPVRTVTAARGLTRRVMFRGFVAEGVRSDGTVDLSEGPGRVRYSFQSPAGHGPQPPREPGTLPRRHYCGKQSVNLRKEGLVAEPDQADYPCPPQHFDALAEPRCGPREVWARARERGAPKDRMARIEYYRSRVGPAWRFELPGTPHRFSLYGDCGQELDAADAIGSVP